MNETRWTPGPWKADQPAMGFSALRQKGTGRLIFALACPSKDHGDQEMSSEEKYTNLSLLEAAPDLYAAAQLACLMFERKNVSTADSDWMGDDEHEAWSALRRAMARARGEEPTE